MLREPEQLDNLMRQRNSHEDLAAAQLKALLLRQKQLQGLEERLKRMEGQKYQNDNPNDSVLAQKQKQLEEFEKKLSMLENSFSSPIDQQEGEIGSITTDNYANNLMTNFPADLQVQRQTLEKLSYLEDQLVQLKELKAQMLQGAEIMERRHMEVKYSNDLEEPKSNRDQVIQMPFDAKDQIEIVDFNQRTSTSKPQDQSNQSLGRSELEVATEAMLGYLNMKEKAETDPVDENAVLQQLMERLMSASVEEKDLVSSQPIQGVYNDELEEDHEDQIQDQMNENQNENNEEENDEEQHEYERLLDEDKEEDDFDGPLKGEDAMSEILATSQRIDTAIDGLGHQINQVKQSESLITTEKEREYFMDVLGKLQTQMDELIEIRSKINYYKELMDQNQQIRQLEEDTTELHANQAFDEVNEHQTFDADFAQLDGQTVGYANVEDKIEGTAAAAEEFNTPSDAPVAIAKDDEPTVEKQTAFEVTQEVSVNIQQVRVEKPEARVGHFTPRPNSSVSFSTSVSKKPSNSRIKRLFEQNKDAIYQNAATFIASYEARPHFLLTLFQKLSELVDDDLAQQEILLVLDEMINVKNEEEGDMSEAEMLQRLNKDVLVIKRD